MHSDAGPWLDYEITQPVGIRKKHAVDNGVHARKGSKEEEKKGQ